MTIGGRGVNGHATKRRIMFIHRKLVFIGYQHKTNEKKERKRNSSCSLHSKQTHTEDSLNYFVFVEILFHIKKKGVVIIRNRKGEEIRKICRSTLRSLKKKRNKTCFYAEKCRIKKSVGKLNFFSSLNVLKFQVFACTNSHMALFFVFFKFSKLFLFVLVLIDVLGVTQMHVN